jgi:hypothetical protein
LKCFLMHLVCISVPSSVSCLLRFSLFIMPQSSWKLCSCFSFYLLLSECRISLILCSIMSSSLRRHSLIYCWCFPLWFFI